ncbi:MAG: sensor domain-containing diguanylate cyclase [Candidatus Saganbacteria bacterium]|nr:sensor domain-containing diguanylate cyclase [Candidatus Saganbacteria bacterium]
MPGVVRGTKIPGLSGWVNKKIERSFQKPDGVLRRLANRAGLVETGTPPSVHAERARLQRLHDYTFNITPETERLLRLDGLRLAGKDLAQINNVSDLREMIISKFSRLLPGKEVVSSHFFGNEVDVAILPAGLGRTEAERIFSLSPSRLDFVVSIINERSEKQIVEDDKILLGLPLIFDRKILGIILISSEKAGKFSEVDLEVAREFVDSISPILFKANRLEAAEKVAMQDPLTGLLTKAYGLRLLEEETERAERYNHKFSILFGDLKKFKGINDKYGHLVGDAVLEKVGEVILKVSRSTDKFMRYAGDEFLGLLLETPIEEAKRLATRLNEELSKIVFKGRNLNTGKEEEFKVAIDIGMAEYPANGKTAIELISKADKDMYREKNGK